MHSVSCYFVSWKWLWKLSIQCGDFFQKLWVPFFEQPHFRTRLEITWERDLLTNLEGLGMNLFLMTRQKCWEAFWNHLSQLVFTSSSDEYTCPSWIIIFWQPCQFCLLDSFLSCIKSGYSKNLWGDQAWRILLCLIYLHTLRGTREKRYFELVFSR